VGEIEMYEFFKLGILVKYLLGIFYTILFTIKLTACHYLMLFVRTLHDRGWRNT